MLFDHFIGAELLDIQDEIINNISDILDSCNHCNDNNLPYAFGITDSSTEGQIPKVIEDAKNAIERFEPRLLGTDVTLISNMNGVITFEISGSYEQAGERIYLRFKKAI